MFLYMIKNVETKIQRQEEKHEKEIRKQNKEIEKHDEEMRKQNKEIEKHDEEMRKLNKEISLLRKNLISISKTFEGYRVPRKCYVYTVGLYHIIVPYQLDCNSMEGVNLFLVFY